MIPGSEIADAAASLVRRVAATVADMRGRRGIDQAGLACLLGVPAERVARLESGDMEQAATLALLAEIAQRLDFHVTLALHDRQPPALGGGEPHDAMDELAGAATLSTVTVTEQPDIEPLTIGFPVEDAVTVLPDETGETFVLDDDAVLREPPDETISQPGGGDGFNDGMSS
ncbi:helix-turn-helix domain-containing protein [Emcibacter sp. SYSU 3D8]|uniref:helix-turn-helix domain-containing protein n=1 Tax=Emcibacter sp. SYSU 3D8 TaxID=3133969 RepID=UPI0031FEE087